MWMLKMAKRSCPIKRKRFKCLTITRSTATSSSTWSASFRPFHFGQMNVPKHSIELIDVCTHQKHSVPYQVGSEAKTSSKTKLYKTSTQNIVRPAETEQAVLLVFAPKRGRSLQFCIDSLELNAVIKTVCILYSAWTSVFRHPENSRSSSIWTLTAAKTKLRKGRLIATKRILRLTTDCTDPNKCLLN